MARALAVLGYADEAAAAEAAPGLLPHHPLTVEGMAADLVRAPAGLPRGGAWLFAETGGATPAEARAHAERILRAADALDDTVVTDPAGQRALWRIREDAAGTATRMPDGTEAWPGWEDCAVPPGRLGPYLRDFRALLAEHGLRGTPYGHFGDGCIHVRIDFDLLSPPGVARFRRFSEEPRGPGRRARRLTERRTRRRPGPRRTAPAHVRGRTRRPLRPLQGHLGPGRRHEPRHPRPPRPARREPPLRGAAEAPGGRRVRLPA